MDPTGSAAGGARAPAGGRLQPPTAEVEPRYTSYYDYDRGRAMWRFWWPTAKHSRRWIPVMGSTRFAATGHGEGGRARIKVVNFLLKHYVLPADPRATPADLALKPLPARMLAALEPVGQSHVIDLRTPEEREDDPLTLATDPDPREA